jgi:hypothetical protein
MLNLPAANASTNGDQPRISVGRSAVRPSSEKKPIPCATSKAVASVIGR